MVDLRSHANLTHSNSERCSAIDIDCVTMHTVYYIINISYLQTTMLKITLYDIDIQLVTHFLLRGMV